MKRFRVKVPWAGLFAFFTATLLTSGFAVPATSSAAVWSPASLVLPPGVSQTELLGVDCFSSTACTAVGKDTAAGIGGAFAETMNSSGWSYASGVKANPGEKNGVLKGVSCVAATNCTSVGSYGTSAGVPAPMAQTQIGSSWSTNELGIPSGASRAELNDVSCLPGVFGTSICVAVGYKMVSGDDKPWAERSGFLWEEQNPVTKPNAALKGVSCLATNFCMAVGSTGAIPLAEISTGGGWEALANQPTHEGSGTDAVLNAVDCVYLDKEQKHKWCMAVGTLTRVVGGSTVHRPFADAWHENLKGEYVWYDSIEIPVKSGEAFADGVSCRPEVESECWIVGEAKSGSSLKPWSVMWNNEKWSQQELISLPTGATGGQLHDISCFGVTSCKAVGWSLFSGSSVALAETISP